MKPIKKAKRKEIDLGEKIVRTTVVVELCSCCKKSLNKYWNYCAYCGEFIERDCKHE